MSDERCDWCLRRLAPEGVSWDDVDDPEGYCWGDEQQGCACDDAHEEAWPEMLSEVARLRKQVAEGKRKLGTARAMLPIQDGRPVSQGALNALLSQRDTAWEKNDRLHEQLEEVNETIRMMVDGYSADLRKADLRGEEAEAQLAEERATSARLRGLLGDMEYVHFPNGLASLCPACYLTPGMGHSVDCRLAAALKEKDHG